MAYFGDLRHPLQRKVYKRINRPDQVNVKLIASTYTGFIVDRMGKHGVMHHSIKPLSSTMKICGPAVTVLGPELSLRRMAADVVEPGDVLVIAAGGSNDYSCFGDGTALKMKLRQVQGVVVDGATRDASRINALGFPCFCSGVTMKNFDYPVFETLGAVNVPVVCGGVQVNPGDLIFGDSDGILVIPKNFLPTLCADLKKELMDETVERLSLDETFKFNTQEDLERAGYEIIDSAYEDEQV